MAVSVGQTLGAYRIEALIGKGAFGQVFRATAACDAEVPQATEVALKVLHDIHKDDERIIHRFHREARLATKLSHPHVVKVLGEGLDKGEHFLVMEPAPGESLTEYLRKAGIEPPKTKIATKGKKGPKGHVPQPTSAVPPGPEAQTVTEELEAPIRNLPIPEAIEILRQVAGVLQAAQDIGLVHRDIKPDNIFVYRDKAGKLQTKVLDFGIAKDMMAQSMSLSSVGGGMGTPAFMSPEQCLGKPLDTRSDLYSLGATAYQMLTGRPPFPGPTPSAYIDQHKNDIPLAACKVNANVPLNLSQVVDRLLAKKPEDRHQKPSDLVEDMNRVERGEVPLKFYRPKKARKHSPAMTIGAILITFLIVAGGGGLLFYLFLSQAEPTIKEEVGKARFQAEQGKLKDGIETLDGLIAKYKALARLELLGDAMKLRDELRNKLLESQRQAEAQRAKEYEQNVQQGLAAFQNKQYAEALQAFELARAKRETPEVKLQVEKTKTRIEMEKQSRSLLAEAQTAFTAGDFQKASDSAERGIKDFSDSDEGKAFADLRLKAEQSITGSRVEKQKRAKQLETEGADYEKKGDLRNAQSAWRSALELSPDPAVQRSLSLVTERIETYDRLVNEAKKLLEEGRAAKDKPKCLEAAKRFAEAKTLWANAEIDPLIAEANAAAAAIKERIAVVDFATRGDVGVADAGKIVASILLSEFAEKFELIERTQLETLLKEKNLQLSDLMDADNALKYGKLLPVRYLVVGEVMKGADFWLTAKLVEVGPGIIRSPRKVNAVTYQELEAKIPLLGKLLTMEDQKYRKWQDEMVNYPKLISEAKQAAQEARWKEALTAYERAGEIQPTPEARDGVALATQKLGEQEAARAEAERKKKAYHAAYEEAKAAFEKAQGSEDKETWQGVVALAEKAIATGHSDVSDAQGLLEQAKKHLGPPVPKRWTAETKRVKVLTPDGEDYREITYYTNTIGMKLVLIPAGEFMMGSPDGEESRGNDEGPQHKVRITRPFYMRACETTQAEYEQVMHQNPASLKGENNPVECVSWNDAEEFCKRLSQKEGLEYRLPTEAEWEYACRAGSTSPFYTGATISTDQANYHGNYTYGNGQKGEYRQKTTPVGSFPPNGFGLYDMHGNVWEWCRDWYNESYYRNSPSDEPSGPDSGQYRVVRGGSWDNNPRSSRSAYRTCFTPVLRYTSSGFRLVYSLR